MTPTEVFGLMASGIAAGAINAVAGGGTLLTFPTLLFFNTPPVVANATSTLALVIGTTGSVFGYRRHLETVKPWLWRFVPASILGGLMGSALLTYTSDTTFSKLIPFLILFATVLFLAQGAFRRFAGLDERGGNIEPANFGRDLLSVRRRHLRRLLWRGIGILIASFGFMGLSNIHEMNTLKTVLASLINVVAAVWFIGAG